MQSEGEAEELEGAALAKYKPICFQKFMDGPARENWAGITYFGATKAGEVLRLQSGVAAD